MKARLAKHYYSLTDRVKETPIADTRLANAVHQLLLSTVIDRLVPEPPSDGPQWVTYDGANLYLDPTDHVGRAIYKTGRYEPAVGRKIREILDPGDTAIDVGGYIGHHSATMRRCVGSSGRVLVFEPHPRNHSFVQKTVEENGWENVTLYKKALSDDDATQLLSENPVNLAGSNLKGSGDEDADDAYTVETVRLTDVLSEANVERVDLLKIDVEGSESEIVRDLENDLDRVDNILVELHPEKGLSRDDVSMIYDVLTSSGTVERIDGRAVSSEAELQQVEQGEHVLWTRDASAPSTA